MFALTGIGKLVTNDPSRDAGLLGTIDNAGLVADSSGRITWVGPAAEISSHSDAKPIDVGGRCVIPGFVDSHTHLVFAGDRAAEFEARMAGRPYSAGGIRTTMAATRGASDETLRANVARLAAEALASASAASRATLARNVSSLAPRVAAIVVRMPPAEYGRPAIRASNSAARSPANTRWV